VHRQAVGEQSQLLLEEFGSPVCFLRANVKCTWAGLQLLLQADNDFDEDGLAVLDEFSDAISANIEGGFDGDLKILSVSEIDS
jgi:hypothetical protein